jgi:hypothetical protein
LKILTLMLAGAMVLAVACVAEAEIGLTVSAQITSGTSMGTHTMISCNGYNYDSEASPWTQAACYSISEGGTSLTFGGINGVGGLVTQLYDSGGSPIGGADCFYAANFHIVYLFPDAWGGAGYEVRQSPAALPGVITDSVVLTPTYSEDDEFCYGTPQTCIAQGTLNSSEETWNPQLTPSVSVLARNGSLLLRSNRGRIIRAEYGIPPYPDTGETRPTGWSAIPLTATAGTYTATVNITMTEW